MGGLRKVVVTPPNFDGAALDYLRAHGCEPVLPAKPEAQLSEGDLRALLAGAEGWIIGPSAHVTPDLVAALPECRVFARRGVGYERLDIDSIKAAGRVAAIATGGNDASVADAAVGLMLAVGRRMREQQNAMLSGDWSIRVSTDLYRKTVGIIGMGRSGRALAQRLKGFEAILLCVTPHPNLAWGQTQGVVFTDLATLLRDSDYVSIHAPFTPQTRHLIGAAELAAMKSGAILINTARGGLVDDRALLEALRSGHLGGAGLDVYEGESDPQMKPVAQALLALPNVVGMPHSAASTREGLARTNMIIARTVVAVLDGAEAPEGCVIADGR
jgi:D-3-phosphoglycerate dehydrogenase